MSCGGVGGPCGVQALSCQMWVCLAALTTRHSNERAEAEAARVSVGTAPCAGAAA